MEITCRVDRPKDPRKTPLFALLDSLYDRVSGRAGAGGYGGASRPLSRGRETVREEKDPHSRRSLLVA